MDILRKELNMIYEAQHLDMEALDPSDVAEAKAIAAIIADINSGCAIVTDASCDKCYIYAKGFGTLIGLTEESSIYKEENSSDEDEIYNRLHPEDLVEKRMLEYEFFKMMDSLEECEKKYYKATCRIRMKDRQGIYRSIENSTQIIGLSPAGKIWLILCFYNLSSVQTEVDGIAPHIINNSNGEIIALSFGEKRKRILTEGEKEILHLIKDGKPSKIIADLLDISIHTVNRHRQNIIEKLSVGNSIEAITAATAMKLL